MPSACEPENTEILLEENKIECQAGDDELDVCADDNLTWPISDPYLLSALGCHENYSS